MNALTSLAQITSQFEDKVSSFCGMADLTSSLWINFIVMPGLGEHRKVLAVEEGNLKWADDLDVQTFSGHCLAGVDVNKMQAVLTGRAWSVALHDRILTCKKRSLNSLALEVFVISELTD